MDPHAVLNLHRGAYTADKLRANYKQLALQLHPDKCGSRLTPAEANVMFQLLTSSYKTLVAELKAHEDDRQFSELRSGARAEMERQERAAAAGIADRRVAPPGGGGGGGGTGTGPGDMSKRFVRDRFNRVFSADRVKDAYSSGYTDWMARHDPDSAGDALAEEERRRVKKEITKYREPQAMVLSKGGYSELGVENVDDFGRGMDTGSTSRHTIQYSDYRLAHTTTSLVNDEMLSKARKDFDTIDALRSHRETQSFDVTDSDARRIDSSARYAQRGEDRRQRQLKERDVAAASHFERVHQSLLGYRAPAVE